MIENFKKIFKQSYVLASKSPRRIQLLKQIGLKFISVDSKTVELDYRDYNPTELVKLNALAKSRNIAKTCDNNVVVIGADTVVVLNKEILNKPKDLSEAVKFLKLLSSKKHFVYTGINIINTNSGEEIYDYEKTSVYFRKLYDEEIIYYVKNYNPVDMAGAYGIQDDFGCLFIDRIEGDYYNIVGLPLVKLYLNLLKIV